MLRTSTTACNYLGISYCQVDRMKSPRLQVRVIACNYSNMCSQSSQQQGNAAESSPSNDTKDSLTLYLAQQRVNQMLFWTKFVIYVGFSITLRLCSPVSMITAEFVSRFGTTRRSRSRTPVSRQYTAWTSIIYKYIFFLISR